MNIWNLAWAASCAHSISLTNYVYTQPKPRALRKEPVLQETTNVSCQMSKLLVWIGNLKACYMAGDMIKMSGTQLERLNIHLLQPSHLIAIL